MKHRSLSLKQPWAALLAAGRKTIEVRRWRTSYRGPLLIHAARVADPREAAWSRVTPDLAEAARLERGIVGAGVLIDCKHYRDPEAFAADRALHLNEPDWFEPAGLYGLVFAELRELPFHATPGWVRIFEVELEEGNPGVTPPLPGGEGRSRTELGGNGPLSRRIESVPPGGPTGLGG